MTQLYDRSFRDVAKLLRDDDLISLKLVREAADMIEKFGMALEKIEHFGHNSGHGHGYTCANIAQDALKPIDIVVKID